MNMKITEWGKLVSGNEPKNAFHPDSLSPIKDFNYDDISDFIQLYIFQSIPRFIIEKPFIYNMIRKYISKNIGLTNSDYKNIYLTGSAQFGFSLHPNKQLKTFDYDNSDLDFFIVSSALFGKLKSDFNRWEKALQDKNNTNNPAYETSKKNSQNGFFQSKQLPNKFESVTKLLNGEERTMKELNLLLKNYLNSSFQIKKITFRVYESYDAAINQIKLNIKRTIDKNREIQ